MNISNLWGIPLFFQSVIISEQNVFVLDMIPYSQNNNWLIQWLVYLHLFLFPGCLMEKTSWVQYLCVKTTHNSKPVIGREYSSKQIKGSLYEQFK